MDEESAYCRQKVLICYTISGNWVALVRSKILTDEWVWRKSPTTHRTSDNNNNNNFSCRLLTSWYSSWKAMFSQFFILSKRGDSIVLRDCAYSLLLSSNKIGSLLIHHHPFQMVFFLLSNRIRHITDRADIIKNTPELFFRHVKSVKGDCQPFFVWILFSLLSTVVCLSFISLFLVNLCIPLWMLLMNWNQTQKSFLMGSRTSTSRLQGYILFAQQRRTSLPSQPSRCSRVYQSKCGR